MSRPNSEDARWFAANPHRTHRLRRPFPAEKLIPARVATDWVAVCQVKPGQCYRIGFTWPVDFAPPDFEEVAHGIYDALREAELGGDTGAPIPAICDRVLLMLRGGAA